MLFITFIQEYAPKIVIQDNRYRCNEEWFRDGDLIGKGGEGQVFKVIKTIRDLPAVRIWNRSCHGFYGLMGGGLS